jgi:hypothetical protein
MNASLSELILGYAVVGSAVIGIPAIFFLITFLPGLMRTTGELIGTTNNEQPATTHSPSQSESPSQPELVRANRS